MIRSRFPKRERLKSEKAIKILFERGESCFQYPLKLVFVPAEPKGDVPLKMGFTVPKKKFKKAVERNLIKRRVKEAYRLSKHILISHLDSNSMGYNGMIIYVADEILPYKEIEKAIPRLFKKFISRTSSE